MTTVLLLLVTLNLPGDLRVRGCFSCPQPRGIEEGYWAGSGVSFYQRLRFCPERWKIVLLTEKDEGEEWADLLAGGIRYSSGSGLNAAAGALRVQFAHGLLLSHSGSWGSSDPLSLSKAPSWRMRIEPAESPGVTDAGSLSGIAFEYAPGNFSLAALGSISHLDPGCTGLHRSPGEIASRGSVREKLAALRAGWGPLGISFAWSSEKRDSTEESGTRVGSDLFVQGENSILTGEFVTDLDTIANFVLSATRGFPELRHGITVSRNTGDLRETAGSLGTVHRLGAGYGIRWKPETGFLIDAGVLYLQREEEDQLKVGIQFTENLQNRTELAQKLTYSRSENQQTLSGRITAGWAPQRNFMLSLKIPFARYTSAEGENEKGFGIEARLRHGISELFEYCISVAGCSTDGWRSRVYAYSLSFPGEFGSQPLYGNTALLQASVCLHIAGDAVFRAKTCWYCMDNRETLGSGWEETEGPSVTSFGLQLDWNYH